MSTASLAPPRGVNAHTAIAAVAITVLINRRGDIKLIPGLLSRNGGKTRKVRNEMNAGRSAEGAFARKGEGGGGG